MHKIKIDPTGILTLSGEATFSTTPELYKEGCHLINTHDHLTFDLQGITSSDNSGAALLTAWVRHAKMQDKTIAFTNPPPQLLQILKLTGLQHILPITINEH